MTFAFNLAQLANKVNSSGQLSLTTGVTGILPQANGGTGASTLASVAVTSLVAGTGISLNASVGTVTITNTGGSGGATVASSGSNVTLTNASNRVQAITMTTSNDKVILPDATTITTLGGPLFIIVNAGTYSFDVCTTDGYALCSLGAGQSISVALSSSASANANWVTDKTGFVNITASKAASSGLDFSNATTANTTTVFPTVMSVSALSSTAVLITYIDRTTLDGYAVVATISGSTISYGTPVAVYVGSNVQAYCVALSDTAAFVTYDTTAGSTQTFALVISGTTITQSTQIATATQYTTVLRKLDSTRAARIYGNGSTVLGLQILQHNGTGTITAGTATITASSNSNANVGQSSDVVAIDTNKVAIFYTTNNSTLNLNSRIATISGVTPTFGTVSGNWILEGQTAITNNLLYAYAYSTTECGCLVYVQPSLETRVTAGTWMNYIISVSGTGITVGTPSLVSSMAGDVPYSEDEKYFLSSFTQLDTTNAIAVSWYNARATKLEYIPTVGWRIAGSVRGTNSPYGYGVTALSSTSAFVAGPPVWATNGASLNSSFSTMWAGLLKTPTSKLWQQLQQLKPD